MLKGNNGDWAEFYAFIKILGDKRLPSANSALEIEADRFFEFLSLNWNDPSNGLILYNIKEKHVEILSKKDTQSHDVPISAISSKLKNIFDTILSNKKGTFSVPEAEKLMKVLARTSLKAPSSEKSDIFGTLIDRNTNTAELSGFSVKSILKNHASLLNASGQTMFRYEIEGITGDDFKVVMNITSQNSRKVYKDRAKKIHELGYKLKFVSMHSNQFERTLRKIDTILPEFLAEMLVGYFTEKGTSLTELVSYLAETNYALDKFNFTLDHQDYEFKLKQLLVASALGLQPSKPWDGMMKANGGYLIVIKTGDVLCYHAFNRDTFLTYLFENTIFDSPAGRGSPYLNLIKQDGKIYTDLKLQIRFA